MAQPLTLIAATGMAAALTIAFAEFSGDLVEASRARTAADAVALAGVTGGRAAAERLAAANRAEIIAWSTSPGTVTVTVRVGDATSDARATVAP